MTRLVATRGGALAMAAAAAVAASVGLAVACRLPVPLGLAVCAAGAGVALVAVAVAIGTGASPRAPVLGAAIAVCIGAALLRGAVAADSTAELAAHAGEGTVVAEGTVRDSPAQRHSEQLVIVDVERLSTTAGVTTARGGMLAALTGQTAQLLPGDHVRVEASDLRGPGDRPGAESAAALDREGVAVIAVSPRLTLTASGGPSLRRGLAEARLRLSAAVHAGLAEPAATLVDEVALGIRGSIPADISAPLQDAGLIHLVATSGLKVAIVIGLLARLLGAAPPRTRTLVTVAGVTAYVGVAGGGPAAVRAALMAGCGLLLSGTGRRVDPLPLLTVVAAALLLIDPRLCLDVGFQLEQGQEAADQLPVRGDLVQERDKQRDHAEQPGERVVDQGEQGDQLRPGYRRLIEMIEKTRR